MVWGGHSQLYGGAEAAFGAFVVAYVDEGTEPPLEHLGAGLAGGQRVHQEPGCLSGTLAGNL